MFETDCRRPLGFVFAAMLLAASAYGQPPQQGTAGPGPAGAKAGPVSRISIDDAVRGARCDRFCSRSSGSTRKSRG